MGNHSHNKKEPVIWVPFCYIINCQSLTTLNFAVAGFKITSATQSLMRSSASVHMAVNVSGGGHMCMSKPMADAHAVNPVKEQHTRLRVTELVHQSNW